MRLEHARRFPPPWSVEEQSAGFVVRDHNGQRWESTKARRPTDPGLDRIARAAVKHDLPVNILCWGNVDAAVKEVRGRDLMIAVGIRIRNGTINLPQATEEARSHSVGVFDHAFFDKDLERAVSSQLRARCRSMACHRQLGLFDDTRHTVSPTSSAISNPPVRSTAKPTGLPRA